MNGKAGTAIPELMKWSGRVGNHSRCQPRTGSPLINDKDHSALEALMRSNFGMLLFTILIATKHKARR